jgi:hypothetical protein
MTRFGFAAAALALRCLAQDTGSVDGSVVNALNGQPVRGATVVLQGAADSYIASTGADGRYHVDGMAPGSYEARPQHEAFTAQVPGVSPAKVYARFQVDAGVCASVASRLVPLGAISGRIVDGEGDPVSLVRIDAMRYVYSEGKRELRSIASSRSTDRGEFRISGLAPGRYYLMANRQTGPFGSATAGLRIRGAKPPMSSVPTYFPGATDAAAAVPLDLAAGGELTGETIPLLAASTHAIRARLAGALQASSKLQLTIGGASSGGGYMLGTTGGAASTIVYPNAAPAVTLRKPATTSMASSPAKRSRW